MIYSLFVVSGLLFLWGLYNFWKKKPLLGTLFVLAALAGFALGIVVVNLFPDKI